VTLKSRMAAKHSGSGSGIELSVFELSPLQSDISSPDPISFIGI
jgi:hypothetical protein